jgi:acetylornithine deacetylase/succinyl-diaminopimelate desuccinylase-like protein
LNEGGGLSLDGTGKMRMVALQTAEKIYQDYTLTATGTTGHSSVPVADNAIYRLARALDRLSHYTPPNHLIPVTRAYFAHLADLEASDLKTAMRKLAASKGPLPKSALKRIESDPTLAAALHTTCVATLVEGGTRQNALPATASANVNCRILPDETIAQVRDRLRAVIHDPKVDLKLAGDMGIGGTSPAEGEVPSAVAEIAQAMWPGTPVIPTLSRGATDSRFLREKGILAYGINPIAMSETDERRFHGIDERIPVASVKPGLEFFHKLVRRLAEAETKGASAAK